MRGREQMDRAMDTALDKHKQLLSYKSPLLDLLSMTVSGGADTGQDPLPEIPGAAETLTRKPLVAVGYLYGKECKGVFEEFQQAEQACWRR